MDTAVIAGSAAVRRHCGFENARLYERGGPQEANDEHIRRFVSPEKRSVTMEDYLVDFVYSISLCVHLGIRRTGQGNSLQPIMHERGGVAQIDLYT